MFFLGDKDSKTFLMYCITEGNALTYACWWIIPVSWTACNHAIATYFKRLFTFIFHFGSIWIFHFVSGDNYSIFNSWWSGAHLTISCLRREKKYIKHWGQTDHEKCIEWIEFLKIEQLTCTIWVFPCRVLALNVLQFWFITRFTCKFKNVFIQINLLWVVGLVCHTVIINWGNTYSWK